MIGTRIEDWILDAECGRGAMGCVYRARSVTNPDFIVAIKILASELNRDSQFRERFRREIDILRHLAHPGIVSLVSGGIHGDAPYFVMEYVDGGDLESWLRNKKRATWQETLDIALQVLPALKHAHDRGVIHRDLKPSNLLRTNRGVVKLSDFGVAKLFARPAASLAGSMIGNVMYLAPECAAGKPATKRSDLYALGGVLYTLIAGRPPFAGRSVVELIHKHAHALPDPLRHFAPDIPDELERLIVRLMDKEPSRRPADAGFLLKEFQRLSDDFQRRGLWSGPSVAPAEEPASPVKPIQVPASTDQLPPALERKFLERPWVVAALLAVVLGAIVYVFTRPRPSAEDLFRQGAALMESDRPEDWDRAWADYLAPLEYQYPNHPYAEALNDFRERRKEINAQSIAIAMLGRARYRSEAERFYNIGFRLIQADEADAGRLIWQNLVAAFESIPSEKRWVELAQRGLNGLNSRNHSGTSFVHTTEKVFPKYESASQALAEARRLQKLGQNDRAEQIRRAIEELYRQDPGATALFAELRRDRAN